MKAKKKIYFVQVGFDFDGSVYLPYAAGTIAAYALADSGLAQQYEFADFIFSREALDSAESKMTDPYIAAFSCSVWNLEYNKALARRVKQKYPDCTIIFGGHSSGTGTALLQEEPYIDVLMYGEGEVTFAKLLRGMQGGTLSGTPNIAYRSGDEITVTPREHYNDISNFPSPYLTGIFDRLLEQNPQTEFLAVLETNRGCPYFCSYCDWCADKKVRFFPMEKVLGEIRWLSAHKIGYCFCADSNFGMFERDCEIAEALVAAKKETGYPQVFRPCYEKNSDERVFEISRTLNSVGMDKGATLAYQTLCPQALENIGRKNLTLEHFSSLMKKYTDAGIPTYSELILGLPGESKESFCKGICTLLENGQHNSLSVYHCEILPNSVMAKPEYLERFGIEVIKVAFNHIHSAKKEHEEVSEYSYLVRSTATMSRDDWVYANLFSVCIQCFHSLGILRFFAIYLYTAKSISYLDFYTALLNFILNESNGRLHGLWQSFSERYANSLAGDWNYHDEKLGNVTWFFEEGAFLEIISDYEAYIAELEPFLRRFGLESELYGELLKYQRFVIRKPFSYGESESFAFDFHDYFADVLNHGNTLLKKEKVNLTYKNDKYYDNLADYGREIVWFGRRRGRCLAAQDVSRIDSSC